MAGNLIDSPPSSRDASGGSNEGPSARRPRRSWHWARVSKLHDTTADVMSLRQYSPADAGVAIVTKASAHSAVIGAALNFKNCFMLVSLCWFAGLSPIRRSWDVGEPRTMQVEKKQRNSPRRPIRDRNALRRAPLRQ